MVDVKTKTIINCPIKKVSEYSSNPDNAPKWYVNIKSVEWKTPKPLRLGSKIAFKAKFLGKEISYVYKIVELVPEKKLVMSTADGPFPMETSYSWEAIDNKSTKMTLRNKGHPTGFSILLAPFMSLAIRIANNKDLRCLKSILEKHQ